MSGRARTRKEGLTSSLWRQALSPMASHPAASVSARAVLPEPFRGACEAIVMGREVESGEKAADPDKIISSVRVDEQV